MLCIGGMGDGWTRQMARMAELLASLSPGLAVHYLGHWQWRRAARLVAGNGPPLILVGHSWGADRAVRLALDRPGRVARLVTCDPVGWMPVSGLRRLRASVPEWINVQASGGGPWETSNIVARIGRPYGAAACRLARPGRWPVATLGAVASLGSYGIALWAMTRAPVATVAALRETSVLFAMLIGSWFLKEAFTLRRMLGTCAIVGGVMAIRLA